MPETKPEFKPAPRKTSTPTLPPAGDAQREELKQRTDELAEQIAVKAETEESIDPDVIEDDREILAHFDGLLVQNSQPGFVYKWVLYDNPKSNIGLWVTQAKVEGWQVVCGDMPEAKEHEIAGGMRKIGDTVLMRIPQARYDKLVARHNAHNKNLLNPGHARLQQLNEESGNRAIIRVPGDGSIDPDTLKRMSNRARGAMAADQQFDRALRAGSI